MAYTCADSDQCENEYPVTCKPNTNTPRINVFSSATHTVRDNKSIGNESNDNTSWIREIGPAVAALVPSNRPRSTEADTTPPQVTCRFHKRQDLFHVVNPPPGFVPDGTMSPPFPNTALNEPLHIDARNEDGQKFVDVGLLYDITVSLVALLVII